MIIPIPPAPWVPTATRSDNKRLPDPTMDAIASSPEVNARLDPIMTDLTGRLSDAALSAKNVGRGEYWVDPKSFDVDLTGATDSTMQLQAALDHAASITIGVRPNYWPATGGYVPVHPFVYVTHGTVGISATIQVPANVTLRLGASATIKALSTIDGPMIAAPDGTDRTQFHTVVRGDDESATIDCNHLAKIGVYVPYAVGARVFDLTVRDWKSTVLNPGGGFWFGRGTTADADRSWEIMSWGLSTWMTRGTGPGAGSAGDGGRAVWYRNVSDSYGGRFLLNGGSVGLQVDGEHNDFYAVHAWNYVDQPMLTGFLIKRRASLVQCYSDSAISVAFDCSTTTASGTVMTSCRAYNSGPTDGVADALRVPDGQQLTCTGFQIVANPATRFLNGIVGDTSQATITGTTQSPSSIVNQVSRIETMGQWGVVNQMHGAGWDVTEGSRAPWPANFAGVRVCAPVGSSAASGLMLGGEDTAVYGLPAGVRRVLWMTPSNITTPPTGVAVGIYAMTNGLVGIANAAGVGQALQHRRLQTVAANASLSIAAETVVCTAPATITLPNPASLSTAHTFRIVNRSTGTVTLSTPTGVVRGKASSSTQYEVIEVFTDGTDWYAR